MSDDTKELVPVFGNTKVSIADSEKLLRDMESTADEGSRSGDVSYMSFSGKRGIYQIGVDKRTPGETEPFLLAITSFELGWICWKGKKPVGRRLASISAPPIMQPDPEELGPFEKAGEGWSRARAITVKSLENGEQCLFTNNSASGVASMSDLQKDVLERMRAGEPCWPIVTFGTEEFEAHDYTNFKPVFDVVEWVTTEQVETLADPDVDPLSLLGDETTEEEKPEPKVRKRRRL